MSAVSSHVSGSQVSALGSGPTPACLIVCTTSNRPSIPLPSGESPTRSNTLASGLNALASGFNPPAPPSAFAAAVVSTDDLLNKLIDGFEMQEGRSVTVYFQHSGGAIGRVETSSTAFAHRKSIANMLLIVGWPTDDDSAPHIAYLRRYWALLEPATDGYYTVETDDESDSVRHGNYQGNFPRLLEIKRKYDPANLFRLNANIKA